MASSSQPLLAALSPSERAYILTGLQHPTHPTRLDGRKLDKIRNLRISYGDAPMAYGSARVVLEQGWAKKASKQSGEEEEEGGPIGGLGGTEVVAGIKLEVVTGDGVAPAETPDQKRGTEQWRCKVEVDVTPQAFPHLSTQALSSLSSRYSNLLVDHFVPFLPPLTILPNKKYFQPQIHLTVLSASSGSVIPTLFLAARCAFANLHVPLTKSIGWEAVVGDGMDEDGPGERAGTGFGGGEGGISGAVRAAKGNQALPRGIPVDDWDLEDLGGGEEGEGELLDNEVRKGLPVCVTLNLIPNSNTYFLDATNQEESACPSRIHLFFSSKPSSGSDLNVCGIRIEGEDGLSLQRIPGLLKAGEGIAKEMMNDLNMDLMSERNR